MKNIDFSLTIKSSSSSEKFSKVMLINNIQNTTNVTFSILVVAHGHGYMDSCMDFSIKTHGKLSMELHTMVQISKILIHCIYLCPFTPPSFSAKIQITCTCCCKLVKKRTSQHDDKQRSTGCVINFNIGIN